MNSQYIIDIENKILTLFLYFTGSTREVMSYTGTTRITQKNRQAFAHHKNRHKAKVTHVNGPIESSLTDLN